MKVGTMFRDSFERLSLPFNVLRYLLVNKIFNSRYFHFASDLHINSFFIRIPNLSLMIKMFF